MYIILSITFTIKEESLSHSRSYNWTKFNTCRWNFANLFLAYVPGKVCDRSLSLFYIQKFWQKNTLFLHANVSIFVNDENIQAIKERTDGKSNISGKFLSFPLEISSINNFRPEAATGGVLWKRCS